MRYRILILSGLTMVVMAMTRPGGFFVCFSLTNKCIRFRYLPHSFGVWNVDWSFDATDNEM